MVWMKKGGRGKGLPFFMAPFNLRYAAALRSRNFPAFFRLPFSMSNNA